MSCGDKFQEVDQRLGRIEQTLERMEANVAYHIKRTDDLQKEVKDAKEHRDVVLNIVVKQAERARQDQLKTIKVTLGLFAALAILVGALAAWFTWTNKPQVNEVEGSVQSIPTSLPR